MSAGTRTSIAIPITGLSLVKNACQYAKWKCSISEPNALSLSRGSQNNLWQMEFKEKTLFC